MRRAATLLAGLALAVFALGAALLPLEAPQFTHTLSTRYSRAEQAGLSRDRMVGIAEDVRAFVVGGGDAAGLPQQVDGRAGFDAAAVAHLADVARVLRGARILTGVLAALLVATGLATVRYPRAQSRALGVGAVLTVAIPVVAGVAAAVDFDAFFSAFHRLFFAAGTWTFPWDSLLIELFPELFWIAAGLSWAVLTALGAAAFGVAGALLRRRARRAF